VSILSRISVEAAMRTRRYLTATLGAALVAMVMTASVSAAGATVIVQRGGSDCWLGAGDLPGLTTDFMLASSTVVIDPSGGLVVTCEGSAPDGYVLSQTYTAIVACVGDTSTTNGRIVATRSGQVLVMCRFPAAVGQR
jgi:hypothetical protein